MMASKGAIVPVAQVMKDAGVQVRPERLRAGGGRLLHGAQRPDAELPVQQLDHGLPLQQGRLQGRRPRPREAAQDLARGGAGRGQAQGQRPQVPVHDQLASAGRSSRASRPGTTSSSRPSATASAASTRGWPSTRRCTCATSRTWPTWRKQGLFVYKGRSNAADADLRVGRVRDGHRLVGAVRQHQAQRQVRLRHLRRCPTTPTCPARRRTP